MSRCKASELSNEQLIDDLIDGHIIGHPLFRSTEVLREELLLRLGERMGVTMKMYAVVNKDCLKNVSVLLMSDSRKGAIGLWEYWNPESKFDEAKKTRGWLVRKYNVVLFPRSRKQDKMVDNH